MVGMTRAVSSSAETCGAWGRVDWPPMSMICAPLEMKSWTVAMVVEWLEVGWRPPSEKESGVRLRTAMIRVGR